MGVVFGRQMAVEPPYQLILPLQNDSKTKPPYEIRRYNVQRFAVEISCHNPNGPESDTSPLAFSALAKYTGLFFWKTPENEAQQAITMGAPVIKTGQQQAANLLAANHPDNNPNQHHQEKDSLYTTTMAFMLPPEEYDSLSKIPKPTNPSVRIREIPPAIGAAFPYSGLHSDSLSRVKAAELAKQLREDGLHDDDLTDEHALQHYEFWGFNPPFAISVFRRNEIWLPLTQDQVDRLVATAEKKNKPSAQ